MARFSSPLDLHPLGRSDASGRPLYALGRELEYEIGCAGSGLVIRVPEGWITNLATLPRSRLIRWLYREIADPHGRFVQAPVLHDYLCGESFEASRQLPSGFSRFEAAAHFRTALRVLGAPAWQSFSAYWAVRANDIVVWWRGVDVA